MPADAATDTDPLARGDLVGFDHHDYRLSIRPGAGAKRVARLGHTVPATDSLRSEDDLVLLS